MRLTSAILLLLCLVASSCQETRPRSELVFINGDEPKSLDPTLLTGQIGMRVASCLFEGLARYDKHGLAVPGLAKSWTISEDGLTYTFTMQPGAKWSDGSALTARDVHDAWKHTLDPDTASDYVAQLYPILNAQAYNESKLTDFTQVGVKVLDPLTLQVTLKAPTAYFIDLCAFPTLAVVPVKLIQENRNFWTRPENILSNAAYTLESWVPNDHIHLRKNPHYWDADNVALNTISILPISNPNSATNFYLTGEADLVMDKSMIPATLMDVLPQKPFFHSGPIYGTFFTRFNATKAPFDNETVRRAFAHATDNRGLVKKLLKLGEVPATSFTPPGTGKDYQPPAGLEFDPDKARTLLAEAGFPGGQGFPRVEYLYNNSELNRNLAIELQDMWRKHLGVQIDLRKQDWKVYLTSMKKLDYDICRSSWIGDYNDPNTFLDMFVSGSGNNRTGWASPDYDALIEAAARETNHQKRNQILVQAETQLLKNAAVIHPIYYYVGIQFYDPEKIGGIVPNLADVHPLREVYWKK